MPRFMIVSGLDADCPDFEESIKCAVYKIETIFRADSVETAKLTMARLLMGRDLNFTEITIDIPESGLNRYRLLEFSEVDEKYEFTNNEIRKARLLQGLIEESKSCELGK